MPSTDAPDLRLPYDATVLFEAPLRTERLVLRPLGESDAWDVWQYQRLPEVLRYIPWPERTRDEGFAHTAKRAGVRRLERDEDAVFFAMELVGEATTDPAAGDAARDRVIGDVMLRLSNVQHAQLEIGWVVHPDFQGRGLAAEAAGAILDIAFRDLRAHRVHAQLDARNEASARLCERLGMRHEATLREEEYHDGEWEDTSVYALLRREWLPRR
ncbi:GNAT family N-acetyltransferase [Agromyces intestinalis]|uniref:GNAT family N-acetyltransferase n=1 Tax=Agromyces intestinalis TaxID=2592652 RepID=A0A5C1YDZ7_9MICO|nr:GNAT family protein [Agromyces intestinalis]QEO14341.1 GNAT family N-acetyltransferase [Agromyces intestinalis]